MTISDDLIDKGLAFASSDRSITSSGAIQNGKLKFYVYAEGINKEINMRAVTALQSYDYVSFADFKEKAFSFYEITFPNDQKDWKEATCTCPEIFRSYICEHVFGIAHRLKIPLPQKKKTRADEPIAPRKQRGRPKKAGPALQRE